MTDIEGRFFHAIADDDIAAVSELLDANPELICARAESSYCRDSSLHTARSGDMAELLLERGADLHATNLFDATPLHTAHSPAVADILIRRGLDVNARDRRLSTPLHHNFADVDVAAFLIDNGADVNARDRDGKTTLHLTADEDSAAVDFYQFYHQREGNLVIDDDTPIVKWRWIGAKPVAELLLSCGAEVDARTDGWGGTSLHIAAFSGFLELADILIRHGADVNAMENDGWTPLHFAAAGNNKHVAKLLCDAGADANAADGEGKTPLDVAVMADRPRLIALLDQYGGRSSDISRLFVSARNGDAATVADLLLANPSLVHKTENWTKRTALFRAVEGGFADVSRLLLDNGADANALGRSKETPLHVAVERGDTEIVALLLIKGADANAVMRRNRTALTIAAEKGRDDIEALLIRAGAKA